MGIDELLAKAICESHPEDLQTIRKYIEWVKVRRKVHYAFYPSAHWIRPQRRVHWVGRQQ